MHEHLSQVDKAPLDVALPRDEGEWSQPVSAKATNMVNKRKKTRDTHFVSVQPTHLPTAGDHSQR